MKFLNEYNLKAQEFLMKSLLEDNPELMDEIEAKIRRKIKGEDETPEAEPKAKAKA